MFSRNFKKNLIRTPKYLGWVLQKQIKKVLIKAGVPETRAKVITKLAKENL